MNLPFLSGIAYKRWYQFLDIMSFKKQTSIHVSTLRTIIISEADWNAAGKIFVTRRMMRNAEKMKLLPNEHLGGRKGRKSTDGGLTKRLIMDNARMLQKPMTIVSTDAANCYDRMIHKIIAMAAKKWGIPQRVIQSLLSPLQQAQHYTRTAYGDSTSFFTGTNLQGAGQGNTGAAPFWTMISTHMIEIMKELHLSASFISPITKKKIILSLIAFVDDTELFLTHPKNDLKALIAKASTAIKTWRELLKVTGGAMRPEKCAWTLMRYDQKSKLDQHEIKLADEEGVEKPIQTYEEKQSREYLGILQRTDGKENDQIEALMHKIEKWNNQMQASKLYSSLNLKATLSKIMRSLLYPLPALTLTEHQCLKISNKLYSNCFPKCGLSSKFQISFRYLPTQYQGLGLPSMYYVQESSKISELVLKSYSDSICWKQMELSLEIMQSMIGSRDIIFNMNYLKYGHLIPSSWIKSLWKFLHDQNLTIRGWRTNLVPQRENDLSIMEEFVNKGVCKESLTILNKCRRFIDAIHLSDICTGDGLRISELAIKGAQRLHHINSFTASPTKKPSVRDLLMWTQYIRATFCIGSNTNRITKPLGSWRRELFRKFSWYYNAKSEKLLKRLSDTTYRVYMRDDKQRTSSRLNKAWYKVQEITRLSLANDGDIWAATVEEDKHSKALFDGASPFSENTNHPKVSTLLHQLKQNKTPEWVYKHVPRTFLNISKEIVQSMMSQNLRVVSDGSCKTVEMGAATIVETGNREKRIILPTPVPGNSKRHSKSDSYRAEAVGITTALHLIYAMETLVQQQTKIELACDNDRVLEVVAEYTYISKGMKHLDVIRSMLEIRDKLASKIKYCKVKAHKSDSMKYEELTRMEQINTECDLLAKIARTELPKITGYNNVFQHEGISIWDTNQEKISSNLEEALYTHYYHRQAKKVMKEKYGWDSDQFARVGWEAIRQSNQTMSSTTKQWIAKYVTKFLPIGRNMLRRNHWREDYCPRCRICVETHDHLITCTHSQCTHVFRKSLEKLELWLRDNQTPPNLISDILHILTDWKLGINTRISSQFTNPIQNQIQFGIRHFIKGRLLVDFTEFMSNHFLTIGSKRTGRKWTAIFIQKLWTVMHRPQWDNRNSFVHKINEEAIRSRERENMQSELTTLYLSNMQENLLSTDQHLYSKTLSEILQGPNAHILAWIEEMRVALADRDRQFLPTQQKQAAFMHTWMNRTPQPRKPSSVKKRRIRSKPRRQITLLKDRKRKGISSSSTIQPTQPKRKRQTQ